MKDKHLFVFFSLTIWSYLILRAILIQPIHDEIATFFSFVQPGRFIPYFSDWTTNNHVLNSLLTFFSHKFFGSSPFALRLPNILLFPFFLYFIWKISGKIENRYLRWGFILSIILIHNFLEFFALSRGYGLALTLLTGSIWYTIKVFETNKTTYYVFSLLTGFLSVSAILIYVNVFIILIGMLLMHALIISRGRTNILIKQISIIVVAGILPVFAVVIYLLDLSARGRLDYGGTEGFWVASVQDLTQLLAGKFASWLDIYILVISVFIVVVFLILFIKSIKIQKNPGILLNFHWLFFFLLAGNIFGFWIENKLFGVLYPANRTSLQFILFFAGSLFFLMDGLAPKMQKISVLLLIPLLFFPIHFLAGLNLSRVSIEPENIPERFLNQVIQAGTQADFPPSIQGYSGRELRWAYLNYQKNAEQGIVQKSYYPALDADFQIADPKKFPEWLEYYDPVDSSKISGLYLLERNNKLEKNLVYQVEEKSQEDFSKQEFIAIAEGSLDTLAGETLYAGYNIKLLSSEKHFAGWIVFSAWDDAGNAIRYERIPLNWYARDWRKDGQPFVNGLIIHNLPGNTQRFSSYIWNLHQSDVKMVETRFYLYSLQKDY
jgi:hypothetical protein